MQALVHALVAGSGHLSGIARPTPNSAFWAILLFAACAVFFLQRGPYRAIRYSTTGDFSTVYAAARCWLSGSNPYQRNELKHALVEAGAPTDLERDQDVNPSVYLPAALPWAATVSWLDWYPANVAWCLLSVLAFAVSVWKLVAQCSLPGTKRWLLAATALLFSPAYVGIYDGNPSVLAISFTVLAIVLAREERLTESGLLLGVALCFKPQVAVCAVCILALWRQWRPLCFAAATFFLSAALGIAVVSRGGTYWEWWATEQHNVAISFLPGGQSDPSVDSHVAWQLLNTQTLTAYLFGRSHLTSWSVWLLGAVLVSVFFALRHKASEKAAWRDASFAAALTLAITYHRYYDGQLLLLLMPGLVLAWQKAARIRTVAITICLIALAFPLQSVFARRLGDSALAPSPTQFALLRLQPLALLTLSCLLALAYWPARRPVRLSPLETEI